MPTETGDMKTLGNYRKLIDFCLADAGYNPPNQALGTAQMNAQYGGGLASVADIAAKLPPNKIAVNVRAAGFEEAIKRYRRSRAMLKASGVPADFLADAETFMRKIVGKKKTVVIDNPDTPENEAEAAHSAAQQSYDAILGNIISYNSLVAAQPLYKPNEIDLQIAALTALAADLQAKNDAVSLTFVPLSNARATRDALLYDNEECVVNIAQRVKEYVKAAFGTDSVLYKQIKGLQFKRR